MKSVFGMCFNWKVLLVVAAIVGGVALIAPQTALALLPFLLLAACPLSMLLMMGAMSGGAHRLRRSARGESRLSLEQRLAELSEEERRLQTELAERHS